jgi:hypothetical protein
VVVIESDDFEPQPAAATARARRARSFRTGRQGSLRGP